MAGEYIAGAIILGAAPCTAMVFVWSYLTDGDPNYTLVQVLVNDLIILLAAISLIIQTYFIFFIAWFAGRKLRLPHSVCSPAAMIGASNYFELAVAEAIARSTLSAHLKDLKNAGLIQGEINPPFIKYCITMDNWNIARNLFGELFKK